MYAGLAFKTNSLLRSHWVGMEGGFSISLYILIF